MTRRKMTADEFLALPPDNTKTQLIDGELVEMTDVRRRHIRIVMYLTRLLGNWLENHPAVGEVGSGGNWRMNDIEVFVPDVWFQPGPWEEDRVWYQGPPALVVEVRSESTWADDTGRKTDLYLAGGAEVWLVDTGNDTVIVHRFQDSFTVGRGDALSTPLVPGFEIDVDALFDR